MSWNKKNQAPFIQAGVALTPVINSWPPKVLAYFFYLPSNFYLSFSLIAVVLCYNFPFTCENFTNFYSRTLSSFIFCISYSRFRSFTSSNFFWIRSSSRSRMRYPAYWSMATGLRAECILRNSYFFCASSCFHFSSLSLFFSSASLLLAASSCFLSHYNLAFCSSSSFFYLALISFH